MPNKPSNKMAELNNRVTCARLRVEQEDTPATRRALKRARNIRSAQVARDRQREHVTHLHVKIQDAEARIRALEAQVRELTNFNRNCKCVACGQHAPCCVECTARTLAGTTAPVQGAQYGSVNVWEEPVLEPMVEDPLEQRMRCMFLPTAVKMLSVPLFSSRARDPFELSAENDAILREHANACSREIKELTQ
jgi:hypothetical protein